LSKSSLVQEGRRRLSVAHLLTTLTVLFIVAPFVDHLAYGNLVESVIFSVMLLTSVSAVGGRQRTLAVAALLAVPAISVRWLHHLWPSLLPNDLGLITDVAFVTFVVVHLFRFVVSARAVNAEVLCAAISIYLLFAVAWAFLYTLLAHWQPGAFTFTEPSDAKASLAGFSALYFSVQVLTTITFGDILPVSNIARMLTLVEAAAGVFYLAIMIARLVGVYSSNPSSDQPPS